MNEMVVLNGNDTSTNIKILLADNFPLVRQALRIFIERQHDMEVVAEANDGREVMDIVTRVTPDAIVMDADMPKMDGYEVTRQIMDSYPKTKILILSDYFNSERIIDILKIGASGYLPKNVTGEEIIHALRVVIAGDKYLPHTFVLNTSQDSFQDKPNLLDSLSRLTNREYSVLKLIANGMSNKDIATKLGIGERSVKYSITAIFTKLGVSSRTEAISFAVKTRLLSINDFSQ